MKKLLTWNLKKYDGVVMIKWIGIGFLLGTLWERGKHKGLTETEIIEEFKNKATAPIRNIYQYLPEEYQSEVIEEYL